MSGHGNYVPHVTTQVSICPHHSLDIYLSAVATLATLNVFDTYPDI